MTIELADQRRWRDVFVIFLTTRIPLALIAWLATYLLASGVAAQPGNLRYMPDAPRPLQAWVHWDADWYLLIADRGYGALEESPELAPQNQPADTTGFFPLYPSLVRLLSTVTGPFGGSVAAALLISNAALLGFLFLLHGWTAERFGEEAGRGACIAVCAFPTSLFLSAPYSESLFLLLTVGTLVAAGRKHTVLTLALGAAAALTRPVGILLLLPLAWAAVQRNLSVGERMKRLSTLAGPTLGLGAFSIFCHLRFGDPLAFLARQQRWRGSLGPPWTFLTEFLGTQNPHGRVGSTVDMTLALLCIAALPIVFRRLGPGPGLFATAAVFLPLSSGLFSFSRLALAAFPLFALVGLWWVKRWEVRLAYPAVGLTFAGLFMALYATGWWVG